MSREKQIIKEMAKDLCKNTVCGLDEWNDCSLHEGYCVRCVNLAKNLYDAGYRKQSEGEWKKDRIGNTKSCSICGSTATFRSKFCPECGAKMKGGAE